MFMVERLLWESIVILEYIEETWPQNYPLLPDDPYERAVARFWTKFGDDQTSFSFFMTTGEEQEKAVKEARELLKILEEHGLGEKKFFGGNEIGMTDLVFGGIACWSLDESLEEAAGVKLLDADSFPQLQAWTKKFQGSSCDQRKPS